MNYINSFIGALHVNKDFFLCSSLFQVRLESLHMCKLDEGCVIISLGDLPSLFIMFYKIL